MLRSPLAEEAMSSLLIYQFFFFFRLGILWALPAFLPYPFGLPQRDQNRKKSQTTP